MNILLLSTFSHTGGAAIAANRLLMALRKSGATVDMLSRRNLSLPGWKTQWGGLPFIGERVALAVRERLPKGRIFAVDPAWWGDDVTQTDAYKQADVVHLHWINQGFLSLTTLEKILHSDKRVVWTMHDQWPMTGICHYSDTCEAFKTECHHCPLLTSQGYNDLSNSVFHKKCKIYKGSRVTLVACSEWLAQLTRESALSDGLQVVSIPNPIDTELFKPQNRKMVRQQLGLPDDATMVLFGCQKTTDKRKGLDYLIAAARYMSGFTLLLVGSNTGDTAQLLPPSVRVISLGSINSAARMADIYAAADCFVTPSLQDNLPNTIMEAMACGTPCVGFNVGGIPEMIDHQRNGYVAEYKNAHDLEVGIRYVTGREHAARLSAEARSKVMADYSESSVAEKYLSIYRKIIM